MIVNGFDHVLKLDFGGPGPTVVDDWLPGSFPAVHWRHSETDKQTKSLPVLKNDATDLKREKKNKVLMCC